MTHFTTGDECEREQVQQVLQAHSEGSSLRGISRITGLAYNTIVSIVRAASSKAQLVHNEQVEQVCTEEVSADASGFGSAQHQPTKTQEFQEFCQSTRKMMSNCQ